MSPRITFGLTLAGVLLAGAPLPWLTRTAPAPAETQQRVEEQESVYATLRVTGAPVKLCLRVGTALYELTDELPWEGELPLPGGCAASDIVVEAAWPEPGEQAVTLTLEPDGRETRSCTRWADAATGELHDIFHFVW